MNIEHINTERKGAFVAKVEDTFAGEMTYSWAGADKIIIDHTEVNPDFSGKGVGKLLLMELVKFARKKQLKVIPLCPFAKSVFDKTEDIRDVLFNS
ncbi:MAG: GNAT family N-acetyltransferase [Bacteroidota bacterium]